MPKSKIPASGGAMPAAAHLDATLLALIAKTLEGKRRLDEAALEKRDAAEERSKPIATPDAIIKTEEDGRIC